MAISTETLFYSSIMAKPDQFLVCWSEKGLCALSPVTQSMDESLSSLEQRFKDAHLQITQQQPDWLTSLKLAIENPSYSFDGPIDLRGTHFQQSVWQALLSIPAGQTRNYQEVAHMIGKPNAVRAVGSACGKNPIAILVPCHRVIRSDGSLQGYYWGIEMKTRLLNKEANLHLS